MKETNFTLEGRERERIASLRRRSLWLSLLFAGSGVAAILLIYAIT